MERLTAFWIDYYGNETMTNISGPDGVAELEGLVTAMLGESNAVVTNYVRGNVTSPSFGAPGTDPYASVGDIIAPIHDDVLVTQFQTFYPAPIKTMFDAGWNAVDILNPTFSAFAVQCFDTLMVPQSGYPVQTTPAGWLLRQCPNIRESYIINPSITGGHPARRRMVVWGDNFGQRVLFAYPMMDVSDAWLVAAAAMSNAIVLQTWEGLAHIYSSPAPAAAPYAGVKDFARLTFADAKGNRANLMLPAPKLEVFRADQKTVNSDQIGVEAIILAALAYMVAPQSGLPVTKYIGGILVRTRTQGQQ